MTPKQEKALAALISNPNRNKAAKAAGITTRTLRTYFHDEEFASAYREAMDDLLSDAIAEGKQLLHTSMQTFKDVMLKGDTSAARTSAARSAAEITMKLIEQVEIKEKIAKLEQIITDIEKREGE